MKTATQIQREIIELLSSSALVGEITGNVYVERNRPVDGTLEDIAVIYTTGDNDDKQKHILTLHIYIEDVEYVQGEEIRLGRNEDRVERLELLAQQWISSVVECFDYITLREPIKTTKDEDRTQHFVVIKLEYENL